MAPRWDSEKRFVVMIWIQPILGITEKDICYSVAKAGVFSEEFRTRIAADLAATWLRSLAPGGYVEIFED